MSYDLMVFDPKAAPTDRAAFLAWYKEQTEWAEDHTYDDPAVTTERYAHGSSTCSSSFRR